MAAVVVRFKAGDALPDVKLTEVTNFAKQEYCLAEYCKDKSVVIFAVPGAFTPGCSKSHLPSFVNNADALFKKGIDSIICVATNDAYVMEGWGKDQKVGGKILMLSDGDAKLTTALGVRMESDVMVRSERYAMVVKDNKIQQVFFPTENDDGSKDSAPTYGDFVLKSL